MQNADPATFEALNLTYAKDKFTVWTLRGHVTGSDAESFMVCDNGRHSLGMHIERLPDGMVKLYESFVPYGYGKDKNNVYYYDACGKICIVRKAIAASFISMNDGDHFGDDEASVFHGRSSIPKAKLQTCKKLLDGFYYSKDQDKIFYFNWLIKEADAESFEVVLTPCPLGTPIPLAKDKRNYYCADDVIPKEEFEEYVKKRVYLANKFNEKCRIQ